MLFNIIFYLIQSVSNEIVATGKQLHYGSTTQSISDGLFREGGPVAERTSDTGNNARISQFVFLVEHIRTYVCTYVHVCIYISTVCKCLITFSVLYSQGFVAFW